MQPMTIVLLALMVLAYARTQSLPKSRDAWLEQFGGRQRIFGGVALILALFIILNPEFYALGLLGDTAFFDMLVLALALQISQTARTCLTVGAKVLRFGGIPSPGLRYICAVSSPLLARVLSRGSRGSVRLS